ncbi:ATP-binding protein [Crossiella equi]|uniref:ATP-binding protein n=1 Tax=Crossiella equi TaxID=130796 RepID=UPI0023EBF41D|nr:BTAD domain-containing putative transcriptional regulator [Crossiella equi]
MDADSFRALVAEAGEHTARGRQQAALDRYTEALALWHGPAGDGVVAAPVFAALDREFLDACTAAAALALALRQPDRVLRPLRLAASMAPLHEPAQAALVSALAATGQHAEALRVFREVCARLAEELGIGPGPALCAARPSGPVEASSGFVGRAEELAVLCRVLAGGTGLVLVEGEAGAGKTRLLEELAAHAGQQEVLVLWGRSVEDGGAPSLWPWTQVLRAALAALPAAARARRLAEEVGRVLGPAGGAPAGAGAQFRLFEQVVAVLAEVAARRPVLLLLDDLHWADRTSLRLFAHLATRVPRGGVVVGALRDRVPQPGADLTGALAAAGRVPGHRRLRLGPLGPAEVAGILHAELGASPDPETVRAVHARTSGNPFFVRELARLLPGSPGAVPATVQDVVLSRLAGLAGECTGLLRVAALIGREVDLGLLARAAGVDLPVCLDLLDPLTERHLVEPVPGDPSSVRFAHDLVREAVTTTTSPATALRTHLRIADALTASDLTAEALAHHLWSAGALAAPERTTRALVRAGKHAADTLSFENAERHLRRAVELARTAGLMTLELAALTELNTVLGMQTGYGEAALEPLARAEHLARGLGRELAAAEFLLSRWTAATACARLDLSGQLAHRLLQHGESSPDPLIRAYGHHAWGTHQRDLGNLGEAHRHLSRCAWPEEATSPGTPQLRHDMRLFHTLMLAEVTALRDEVGAARELLAVQEWTTGENTYSRVLWATFTASIAAAVGDPAWALRMAEQGLAVAADLSFVLFGPLLRLHRCWALAVSGQDPAGAAEQAHHIVSVELDPPRPGAATWYGLLAEMRLAAGQHTEAAAALDRAESFLDVHGQRHPEWLLVLLRARLARATGAPAAAVRAAADRARVLSEERGALLFARRAEELR